MHKKIIAQHINHVKYSQKECVQGSDYDYDYEIRTQVENNYMHGKDEEYVNAWFDLNVKDFLSLNRAKDERLPKKRIFDVVVDTSYGG